MWIILEGCTAAGKSTLYSTLIQYLADREDDPCLVHMDRPEELTRRWVLNEYANKWQWYDGEETILADRWHFGEATYSPIYRPDTNKDGYGLLGKSGWRWIELFLMSRGAVIAQLTAPIDVLLARLDERGDDHVQNHDELRKVAGYYRTAVSHSPNTTVIFDTGGKPDPSEMARRIIQLAEITREYVRELREYPGYIGPRRPAVLLLGDKRNVTKKYGEETQLPFMPVAGNSGEYLLNALPDLSWQLVGVANAAEQDDLRGLWTALGRPPVSALGNQAALAARKADVPAVTFNHPQYMRRFKNGEQTEYGSYILQDTVRSS